MTASLGEKFYLFSRKMHLRFFDNNSLGDRSWSLAHTHSSHHVLTNFFKKQGGLAPGHQIRGGLELKPVRMVAKLDFYFSKNKKVDKN